MKILVIDESVKYFQPIAEQLVSEGYEVVMAEFGLSVVHLVDSYQPDLVIVDIAVPTPSSEILKMLHNIGYTAPILVLSDVAEQVAGCTEVLCRSTSTRRLVDKIKTACMVGALSNGIDRLERKWEKAFGT